MHISVALIFHKLRIGFFFGLKVTYSDIDINID